jgi:hypothetical protein
MGSTTKPCDYSWSIVGSWYMDGIFGTLYDVNVTGDVYVFDVIYEYYFSDERFKDNMIPISNASEKIKFLNGYSFDWKEEFIVFNESEYGIMAQEMKQVMPNSVRKGKDGYLQVKYTSLVPLMIEGIKEQDDRILNFKNRIENLKNRIENLKNKLD